MTRVAPDAVPAANRAERLAMYNGNQLKLGLFGSNCSSGRAATRVPERWSGSWDENLAMAKLADEVGLDFILPIGRWKGYGGETNYEGATFETVTWATGLLAATEHVTVFGTVHAPLIHPVFAAKMMMTADHVGHGRFALNLVCGWNADEFAMFGAKAEEHDLRYVHGEEWLHTIFGLWQERDAFDVDAQYFHLEGVWGEPKPYGGTRPMIVNAAFSEVGRQFAYRNCDFLFSTVRDHVQGAESVAKARESAAALGREVGVFAPGYVVCRPTRKEAEEYHHYYAEEMGDWGAVEVMITNSIAGGGTWTNPELFKKLRVRYAGGHGGYPIIGSPDDVAAELAQLSADGFSAYAFSFVNYLAELPYFAAEVLPRLARMGLRVR